MSTVSLPMNRFVELLPPPAGDEGEDEGEDEDEDEDEDDGRVSLGVGLAGAPLAGAVGVPAPPTLPAGTSCHC